MVVRVLRCVFVYWHVSVCAHIYCGHMGMCLRPWLRAAAHHVLTWTHTHIATWGRITMRGHIVGFILPRGILRYHKHVTDVIFQRSDFQI